MPEVQDTGAIALGDLAEQMDMKALIAGMDLGYAGYFKSYLNAMAMGLEDARASQRRTTQATDIVHTAMLGDIRATTAAQNGTLVGANGARQDTLATTETEQAMSNAIQAQERLAEEMARFQAQATQERQQLAAALDRQQERTAQLENTLSTALASILAKLDAATNPSTPVGPAGG